MAESLSSTARGVRPGARICSRYFDVTASGLPRACVLRDSSLFYIVLSVGADTVHGEVTLRRSLRTTSTSSGGITSFAFRLIPPAIGGRLVLMASRSMPSMMRRVSDSALRRTPHFGDSRAMFLPAMCTIREEESFGIALLGNWTRRRSISRPRNTTMPR